MSNPQLPNESSSRSEAGPILFLFVAMALLLFVLLPSGTSAPIVDDEVAEEVTTDDTVAENDEPTDSVPSNMEDEDASGDDTDESDDPPVDDDSSNDTTEDAPPETVTDDASDEPPVDDEEPMDETPIEPNEDETENPEEAGLPWWNDRVFYEIFIRSFYDSDGDGIGDIQGIIQQLDYLNDGDPTTTDDLGITGIWLMPPAEAASYHGYDVTDYYTVESDYGTNEDLQQLVKEAHSRGIAVIIDLVVNHTSSKHPWFVASRTEDENFDSWYIWEDENPGYVGPWGAVAWHRAGNRYYYGVFWDGMPDLNYRNQDVVDEMNDIAAFWLNDMGVDGFRLDAIKHIIEDGEIQENTPETREWLAQFHDFSEQIKSGSFSVGEIFNGPSFMVAQYVEDGAMDMGFDFMLAERIISSAQRGNARDLARQHRTVMRDYPFLQFATFLTNHDQNRLMSQLLGDVGANKVAATVLLTGPGVPFLYYGEEIGMVGTKPDERIRTPFHWDAGETAGFTTGSPWEPLTDNVDEANVADQTTDADSLLSHYRTLIHLRNDVSALRHGDLTQIEADHRAVYAFLRHDANETVLVLVNLDDEAVSDYTLELKDSHLTSVESVEWLMGEGEFVLPELTAEGGFVAYTPLAELPPHSSFVVRLN